LVWPVLGLSDEDKQTALQIQARARGLTISPEVFEYILKNSDRDLHHLSAMLALLDEYSLEQKRALTLPFVKSILKDLS
jgi:DnaA family protein